MEAAWRALRPGGVLLGLFFRFDPPDDAGPPFVVEEAALRARFADRFEIFEWRTPEDSHEPRVGRERLVAMRRRDAVSQDEADA